MQVARKCFIATLPEKTVHNTENKIWIQGFVVQVEDNAQNNSKQIVVDDGTGLAKVDCTSGINFDEWPTALGTYVMVIGEVSERPQWGGGLLSAMRTKSGSFTPIVAHQLICFIDEPLRPPMWWLEVVQAAQEMPQSAKQQPNTRPTSMQESG